MEKKAPFGEFFSFKELNAFAHLDVTIDGRS